MTRLLEARHATQLPDQPAEWIHVLPAGRFQGRDGRGPYHLKDAPAVIAATHAYLGGIDLVVDYDHQTLKADQHSGAVPAAGWCKELEAREDGIWARVAWTDAASAALQAKEYRYFSPVYDYDPRTGEVVRLKLGALTNVPNLHLQAVASRQGDAMNELMERLCYLLNLPLTTTAEEMKAQLDKLKTMLAGVEATAAASAELAQALGLEAGAALPAIATAVQSRLAQGPDPAQWVPKAQYDQVAMSLATLQADQKKDGVARLVAEAMASGKVAPAMESWATDYASRDLEGFQAFVASAPVLVAPGGSPQGAPPQTAAHSLTPEDEAVAQVLGLAKDAFLASKKEQA